MTGYELWKIGKLLLVSRFLDWLGIFHVEEAGQVGRAGWTSLEQITEAPGFISSDDLYLFGDHGVATCRTASSSVYTS